MSTFTVVLSTVALFIIIGIFTIVVANFIYSHDPPDDEEGD